MAILAIPPKKEEDSFGIKEIEKLKQIGIEAGKEREIKKITDFTLEQPKEIFSGGIISDIFDVLNALQYGVTGVIKGKSFAEGVEKRESFSDKDVLGDLGVPGVVGGLFLDIAVDPLTYIPVLGVGTALWKSGKTLLGKAGTLTARKVPLAKKVGDFMGRKFIYRYGQDPLYKELAERSERAIIIGQQHATEISKPLLKLSGEHQRTIAAARKAGKLEQLPIEFLTKAKPAFEELDKLGKLAVKEKLLSKSTWEVNVGRYMARLFRKKEVVEKLIPFAKKKPIRIGGERIKFKRDAFGVVFQPAPNIKSVVKKFSTEEARNVFVKKLTTKEFIKKGGRIIERFKPMSEDTLRALGEIKEVGYPTALAMIQLIADIERSKFFKLINKRWAKDVLEDGYKQLPINAKLGALSGRAVPLPIFEDIQQIIAPIGGIGKKLVAGFKFGKVILNPATHARNIMSNFLLNNFEGLNPARIDIYARAAKELKTKGKYFQEAQKVGLGLNTFAAQEIRHFLTAPEVRGISREAKNALIKISDLYQGEENFAKMAQYIFQRKKGLNPEKAWVIAERATFNYAQVTPFIRKLRESIFGFPFITFTYKVTPIVIKTAVTKPTKISNIGKIKNAIENLSPLAQREKERGVEPDYIRNGFYIRLPKKDKYNRALYFDLSYIIPFGELVSGQAFIAERPGETPLQILARKAPLFNTMKELLENKDFFGNDIIKGTSYLPHQIGADIMKHLLRFYLPPLTEGAIETAFDKKVRQEIGLKGALPFRIGRSIAFEKERKPFDPTTLRTTRTVTQEVLRGFAGLKVLPFNVEKERVKREIELQKELMRYLEAEGIIKIFKRGFVPKEK